MEKVKVYSTGVCYCSVCADKDLTLTEVESIVNGINHTGLKSKWKISTEDFMTGEKNPHECEKDSSKLHYLMVC